MLKLNDHTCTNVHTPLVCLWTADGNSLVSTEIACHMKLYSRWHDITYPPFFTTYLKMSKLTYWSFNWSFNCVHFFPWPLFPLSVCGVGAGVEPRCIQVKVVYTSGRVISSLQGPTWAFAGLAPCSTVPQQCSGVLAPSLATSTPFNFCPQLELKPRTLAVRPSPPQTQLHHLCLKMSFTNFLKFINIFIFFLDSVMVLLRELGRGYLALCSYNCREAINILTSLPPQHYNTGWVLTHIGRAYFELAEYTQVTHKWRWLSVKI